MHIHALTYYIQQSASFPYQESNLCEADNMITDINVDSYDQANLVSRSHRQKQIAQACNLAITIPCRSEEVFLI